MKIVYGKHKYGYSIKKVYDASGVVTLPSRHFGHKIIEIEKEAFADQACIMVRLPKYLMVIGDNAFRGCTKLEFVAVPCSLGFIGDCAFEGCTALESADWAHVCLKTIGAHAFRGCSNLGIVRLPNTVSMIGPGAFEQCNSLQEFENPKCNSVLENMTFAGCSKLRSVTGIDDVIFGDSVFDGTPFKEISNLSLEGIQ